MDKQHPHFGATYKTLVQANGTYNVEVAIPGSAVVVVSKFKTEAAASAWISDHQREIAQGTLARANLLKTPGDTPKT